MVQKRTAGFVPKFYSVGTVVGCDIRVDTLSELEIFSVSLRTFLWRWRKRTDSGVDVLLMLTQSRSFVGCIRRL
jgi:hypothetical protein